MNELLQKVRTDYLAKLEEPRLKPTILRMVEGGKKIMYSPETRDMLIEQLSQDDDEAEKIGGGIAKIIGILFNASKGTAPMQVIVPAAVLLLCEGLQFLEDAGVVQVDLPFFEECIQATSSSVLQLFGVTPEKLDEMVNSAGAGGAAPSTPAAPGQGLPPPTGARPNAPGIIGAAMGGA